MRFPVPFKPSLREQSELFPPRVGDLVPAEHLVRVTLELVSQLDLSDFEARYDPLGQRAYPPDVMLAILLYGVTQGVRSSRKLARMCREDIPMRWLSGVLNPDFRTISDFRKNHRAEICDLLAKVVRLARRLKVVKLSLWAVDGSVIKASANTGKARKKRQIKAELERLKESIGREMDESDRIDKEEDDEHGEDDPGNGLPPGLRSKEDRARRLREALEVIEQEDRETAHPTDPDSVQIKRRNKPSVSAYNAQLTVDTDSGLIVSADVCRDTNDQKQLTPQVEQATENVQQRPEAVVADLGYRSGANLEAMERRSIGLFVPPTIHPQSDRFGRDDFIYDELSDSFTCPAGKELNFIQTHRDRQRSYARRKYRCAECEGCELAGRCLRPGAKGRTIAVHEHEGLMKAADKRAETAKGRAAARKRRCTVEPAFGVIKAVLGLRQFATRGLNMVKAEFALAASAFNLLKLAKQGALAAG